MKSEQLVEDRAGGEAYRAARNGIVSQSTEIGLETAPQRLAADTVVDVSALTRVYRRGGESISVLSGVSLSLERGDYVALMGPSGSGKTTLLNILGGIDSPTTGRVSVGGVDLAKLSQGELARWRSRCVGFIFQFYNLVPVLTALGNVELPLLLTNLDAKERRKRARLALEVVGLSERTLHYPRQLSGGQQQRVAIARAIVTDPLLLIADEPTGDLDAKSASEILDLLERLNVKFKKTIVMVTHDAHAAARAHRRMQLEKGQLMVGAA